MHLRDWMKLNNVTQQELARRMSPPVSQAKVSHWLQGARRIDLNSALQLESITGGIVTVRDLAGLARPGASELPDEAGARQEAA
jgi:DNA-binding transcriptional regulator YdaS (Cro superfamily)